MRFADVEGLVVGRSGLSGLTDYWAAEALITAIDPESGRCTLSKPLIWNELTFGTRWLDVNNYYAKDDPKTPRGPDFLNRGGTCWELASRTVEALRREPPNVRCIWGFSNTTFYHCALPDLPPGTDGQSYHPYGTGTRNLPEREPHKDRSELNLEGSTPNLDVRMPEGYAHTFIQTECLMRLLNPQSRQTPRPEGAERFHHYITEHGVVPGECGIHDEPAGWQLKAHCATPSFCMWLNKGIDVLHYFVAYDRDPLGMGLLPSNLPDLPGDAAFDRVATPPMRAVRNLSRAFAGSQPLEAPRPLAVELVALGPQTKVFEGGGENRPLWHREVTAVLPFQTHDRRFVVRAPATTDRRGTPARELIMQRDSARRLCRS